MDSNKLIGAAFAVIAVLAAAAGRYFSDRAGEKPPFDSWKGNSPEELAVEERVKTARLNRNISYLVVVIAGLVGAVFGLLHP